MPISHRHRFDGASVSIEEVHRFPNHPVRHSLVNGDALFWNSVGLWNHIADGLAQASRTYSEIQSIGADTWGVDFVLMGSDGVMSGPAWCHRDLRTDGMIEFAEKTLSKRKIYEATGLQFLSINSFYQLLAEQQRPESALQVADAFLMMGDYFHFLLTGEISIESTNASTTQLLDPRDQTWRGDLIDAYQLPSKLFRPVTMPGTKLGTLSPSTQARTNLGAVPVIVPATHDTASAVLATPADSFSESSPTWCYISCGTWSLMGVELDAPKITDKTFEYNFTNEGGVDGTTRLLKNIGGLWLWAEIRRSLQKDGRQIEYGEMAEQASNASPLQALIDPDDSSLISPRDMVVSIRELVASTGQSLAENHASLFRIALEGIAMRYRLTLDQLESVLGHRIEKIHIVGGGSKNRLLCQMTADACNREVVAGPSEATAIGNLMMQMIGDQEVQSVIAAREIVRQSFDVDYYTPHDRDRWDDAYETFRQLPSIA